MGSAYEDALAGGAHRGFLATHRELPDHLLRKSERSFLRRIEEHEAWIAAPETKLGPEADPEEVRNLVERKWPNDLRRHRAQLEIVRGILKERTR